MCVLPGRPPAPRPPRLGPPDAVHAREPAGRRRIAARARQRIGGPPRGPRARAARARAGAGRAARAPQRGRDAVRPRPRRGHGPGAARRRCAAVSAPRPVRGRRARRHPHPEGKAPHGVHPVLQGVVRRGPARGARRPARDACPALDARQGTGPLAGTCASDASRPASWRTGSRAGRAPRRFAASSAGATSTPRCSCTTRATRRASSSSATAARSGGATPSSASTPGRRGGRASRSWTPGCASCAGRATCTTARASSSAPS